MSKSDILKSITKPKTPAVNADGIPDQLKTLIRWLVWRWHWNDKGKRWTKVPMSVRSGCKCDATAVANWFPFGEALAAYQGGGYDGIGFALGGANVMLVPPVTEFRAALGQFLDKSVVPLLADMVSGGRTERASHKSSAYWSLTRRCEAAL